MLVHAVRRRWPPVAIAAAAGHVYVGSDDLPADRLFLAKPYPSASVPVR